MNARRLSTPLQRRKNRVGVVEVEEIYPYSYRFAPKIQFLGKSWITRDGAYRVRRVGIAFVSLVVFLVMGALTAWWFLGLAPVVAGERIGAMPQLVLGLALFSIGAYLGAGCMRNVDARESEAYAADTDVLRRARSLMAGWATLPLRYAALSLLGLFPFGGGISLAVLIAWCLPVPPAERAAREEWQQTRQRRLRDSDLAQEPDIAQLWSS